MMQRYIKIVGGLCLLLSGNVAMAGMGGTVITIEFMDAPTSVPLFSTPMLLVLGLLLFVVAFRAVKNPAASRISALMFMGLALLASSFGGLKLIEEAQATGTYLELADNGSKISNPVTHGNYFAVENNIGTPQVITNISMVDQGPPQCEQNTGGGVNDNLGMPDCMVGGILRATEGGNRNPRSCQVRVVCNL